MPPRQATPKMQHRAAELRHNLTPAEQKLWSALRNEQLGFNFRRQYAIGPFIADFCCIKKKLIIELDGSQHLEQELYDRQRTEDLQARGYQVLRFWNNDVLNDLNGVIIIIQEALR